MTINWKAEPDKIKRVRDLAVQGFSAREMAAAMGVTKGSIIGVCHREKIPLSNTPGRPSRSPNDSPKSVGHKVRQRPITPKTTPLPIEMIPTAPTLSIFELSTRTCSYPFGNEPPFMFCGQPVEDGSVYCTTHHSLCFRRGTAINQMRVVNR